jgi:thiosulfate reductase cytochrome b subunit
MTFSSGFARVTTRPAGVRIAHWINAVGFICLVVSGAAILLAHPRLYWGETGTVGVPALVELPLPFVFGHSGWGRYLHLLAAWVCVLNGVPYVINGLRTRRFGAGFHIYSRPQRAAYVVVIFVAFPLMVWSGLAMSPAVTSVFPSTVVLLGGQQSARTIHFFAATILLLFLLGHVAMVSTAGERA